MGAKDLLHRRCFKPPWPTVKDDALMNTSVAGSSGFDSPLEQLRYAREIVRIEGEAVVALAARLDARFCRAVNLLFGCDGSVIVMGMGKAGLVGQKIAATLASTGTRSHFLHPGEAIHGDLGRVRRDDVVLGLSQSGATEEVTRVLPSFRELGVPVIAITGNAESQLARSSTVTLELGPLREACSLGLAPSTSTTAMLALGDALALVTSRMRRFGPDDFARFHPGGSLGRKLARVEDAMRPIEQCRVARAVQTVRQVLIEVGRPGRRTGAVMLTDDDELAGLFTDSDLARLFEQRRDASLDRPIREVMTAAPMTVALGQSMATAIDIFVGRKISELPVVDAAGSPRGLIDITDVLAFLPKQPSAARATGTTVKAGPDSRDVSAGGRATVPFPERTDR